MAEGDPKTERFLSHLKPLQGALENYCRRGLNDRSGVEDILQEAITKAFRDFDRFSEGSNFRAWIFRYVHLTLLEANRKQTNNIRQPITDEPIVRDTWKPEPNETLLQVLLDTPEVILQQCGDELNQALWKLQPSDRSVLLLKSIGEFKYREIAEILGIPLGTVMSSLSRARQRVRHELSQELKSPDIPCSAPKSRPPQCDS